MTIEVKRIRVHPGIGIARLGNSDEFYIGPEAPGIVVNPGGSGGPGPGGGRYRDKHMKLKRQAQRYRIYGYDADDKLIGELNAGVAGVSEIQWRVHVRNMKAANYAFQGAFLFDNKQLRNPSIQPDKPPIERDQLIIDPGATTIGPDTPHPVKLTGNIFSGVNKGELSGYLKYECYEPAEPKKNVTVHYTEATNIELGQLHLDDKQRLLFVPGPGLAKCVTVPKVELSNPSEKHASPNGPDPDDPLINQFAYFNVPGWWDDTCGGEIDATVTLKDGTVLSSRDGVRTASDEGTRNAANGAWVVSAPPKYAPHMYHVVSILDRVFEAFPEADPNKDLRTNFYRDVYPILARATNYGWVSAEAAGVEPSTRNLAHGPKQAGNLLSPDNLCVFANPGDTAAVARKQIYALMRHAEDGKLVNSLPKDPPPVNAPTPRAQGSGPTARGNKMPKLWGTGGKPLQNQQLGHNLPDQYLSLTNWQLARMEDWANGDFEVGVVEPPKALEELPLDQQPLAMDCAALEPTIGGGFHPGIEFPYLIVYREKFAEAFRVANGTEPGSVAAYMSSPWQGDYWSCNTAWWPVQRPEIVFEYDKKNRSRTYREWFRGYDSMGQPLSSTDGYDQMVYAWPKLGMVLPTVDPATGKFLEDNNSVVYQEYERDLSLNNKPKKHHRKNHPPKDDC